MRKKKINIPIYFGLLTIIQTKDFSALEKKYDLTSLHGRGGCVLRNHRKDGFTRYIMAFLMDCTPRTIAHESLHMLSYIFEDRNIQFQYQNDEPQTYLLGWIVGECHKFLKIKKLK